MRVVALVGTRLCRTPECDGEATGASGIDAYCRACRQTMPCVDRTTKVIRALPSAMGHDQRAKRSHVTRAAIQADYLLHKALEAEQQARWAREDANEALARWKRGLEEVQRAQGA